MKLSQGMYLKKPDCYYQIINSMLTPNCFSFCSSTEEFKLCASSKYKLTSEFAKLLSCNDTDIY